jgi:hypothetical protein
MKFLTATLFFLLFVIVLSAFTTIPAGPVSGNWTATGSPYNIMGNISIINGAVLTIDPGVEVLFHGIYKLDVMGQIVCNGAESNNITFTVQDTLNGWLSIRFTNLNVANQPSSFNYTNFYYGRAIYGTGSQNPINSGGAIYADNAGTLTFNNCVFKRCKCTDYGSAICAKNGTNIIMNNCTLRDNESGFFGGVYVNGGSIDAENCKFLNNTAVTFGAAIYLIECTVADITSCYIVNNSAAAEAGIYSVDSPIVVTNSLFQGNHTTTGKGGGLGVVGLRPRITNCTFVNNSSPMYGGAIWLNALEAPAYITNSIFWGNLPNAVSNETAGYQGGLSYCSMQVAEGDTTNIAGDPQFTNPDENDFTLLPNSPCIDRGTPNVGGLNLPIVDLVGLPRIVDGNSDTISRIDIGCYEMSTPITIGDITGQVTDNLNQPLSGASITVDALSAVTNADGFYTLSIEHGTYRVHCIMQGYQPTVQDNIVVNAGQITIVNFTLNPVSNSDPSIVPVPFILGNHPNPFADNTSISFSLPKSSSVKIEIYNVKGQRVKTLVNENMKSGSHDILWNGSNESNQQVGNGIYLCKLICGKDTLIRKLIKL